MTISLKCFMRRLLRRSSSCQRASISGDMVGISGVMVNSSSFIRSSLGVKSPTQSLCYAPQTLRVKKIRPTPPARRLLRLGLEEAAELHGQPHVSLELQLAGHEGHLAVELAADHVEPVGRGHGHGEIR